MDAVIGISGRGGWPMSVFLTPNLRPFWGGTFFYRDQFIRLLKQIHDIWANNREELLSSAEKITRVLEENIKPNPKAINKDLFDTTLKDFENSRSLAGVTEGKPSVNNRCTVYMCRDGTCQAPETDLEKAFQQIISR
jgi:uncharacterized protein YyaL (SSP411 family)